MAGDWIKMRGNLWDDPRVSRLCDLTSSPEAAIVGGLYWLWAAADQHTENGLMPGLSVSGIDRKTGVKGLGAALVAIGWVEDLGDAVRIVHFEEHNGSSAKRRTLDAQRKASTRAPTPVVNLSAFNADKARTNGGQDAPSCGAREEKKREDKKEKKTGAVALLLGKGIPESLATDFAAARAAKHAPLTATALEGIEREAKKAGMSLEAVLRECCTRGWQSFKAQWMVDAGRKGGSAPGSDEWFDSRSGVEAKAGEFGIKPWVETEEQWPAYRQRVMKAAKGSSEGFLSLDQLLAIAPERKAA